MGTATRTVRRPLSVWELPKLLEPVHKFRAAAPKKAKERPHFAKILAFVHRNRYATAEQIQRRFNTDLRSDRTARRHLAELQDLGWLDIAEAMNASPLWPKVYFVTRRGLRVLRSKFKQRGRDWSPTAFDRRRSEGNSANHILHELSITEFLLMLWEMGERRSEVDILEMERRSLGAHPSFEFGMRGGRARLQPDAMFLLRIPGRGMIVCFLEIDMGTAHQTKMLAKFRRYEVWSQSCQGREYLIDRYRNHGAANPQPSFRVMTVCSGRQGTAQERLQQVVDWCSDPPGLSRRSLWFASAEGMQSTALNLVDWIRGEGTLSKLVGESTR